MSVLAATLTIPLRGGGALEVRLAADPMKLTLEDRELVFGVIDMAKAYEEAVVVPSPSVATNHRAVTDATQSGRDGYDRGRHE